MKWIILGIVAVVALALLLAGGSRSINMKNRFKDWRMNGEKGLIDDFDKEANDIDKYSR